MNVVLADYWLSYAFLTFVSSINFIDILFCFQFINVHNWFSIARCKKENSWVLKEKYHGANLRFFFQQKTVFCIYWIPLTHFCVCKKIGNAHLHTDASVLSLLLFMILSEIKCADVQWRMCRKDILSLWNRLESYYYFQYILFWLAHA